MWEHLREKPPLSWFAAIEEAHTTSTQNETTPTQKNRGYKDCFVKVIKPTAKKNIGILETSSGGTI
jgi:hypothetical protein